MDRKRRGNRSRHNHAAKVVGWFALLLKCHSERSRSIRNANRSTQSRNLLLGWAERLTTMKYVLIILALLGITVSALALREHYRPEGEAAPCDINARWDCGTVNKSPYAVIPQGAEHGVPVAAI